MVKILHAADLHLDSPFRGLSDEESRRRRQESREDVERLVDFANEQRVELLLLAGDLFDSEEPFAQTGEMISRALGRFAGQVCIAPGNHDPYTAASAYSRLAWPDNVHIFSRGNMECVRFPQYDCAVFGAAFTGESAPLWSAGTVEESQVAIGLLHGDVGARESKYRPVSLAAIEGSGLDYLALGHIHQCSGVQKSGATCWAYPGCLQGRGFDETGDKGFLLGTVDKGNVKLDFVPFARHRYMTPIVTVTGKDPLAAIMELLPLRTEQDDYRITLRGEAANMDLPALHVALGHRFASLELRDQTVPVRDLWEHLGEDTLRGLFLQDLRRQYDATATEGERQKILQAVEFGLDAMENRER